MVKIKYLHVHLFSFLIIWLGLFLDSSTQANQLMTNFLVIFAFLWVYYFVSMPVRRLMLFGLIVAFAGEVLFSLLLGMYTYRLENLPLYVPFGHSIIYASVYYMAKEPLVKKYEEPIVKTLYSAMIIYSTLWLIMANDTFGFLCTLVILALFKRHPHIKLFFLLMYFVIVYLELIGTYYQCWQWPEIWFDKVYFINSANPPSGISVFYFGFDIACLWLYKQHGKERWKRIKNFRKLRLYSQLNNH